MMTHEINADDFGTFFKEVWKYDPFPWQQRLAKQVYENGWPAFIDLPTASGKTACLDVAVFTLAVQAARAPKDRTVGRRIFFVVNRRVIVDEAHERALELARKIKDAEEGSLLHRVSQSLHEISGDPGAPPLDVALLRGGIVRDNRWARSIAQPTIITSTVDQVGSRLLFRGYGVSDAAKPLHAALIAHDSLFLLDEAHISQPFVQTLNAVKHYRGGDWAETPIQTPFHFVQMTATPGETDEEPFRLETADYECAVLRARHEKKKPVRLRVAEKADKGGGQSDKKEQAAYEALAKDLGDQALGLVNEQRRTIAIVVNRILTARLVKQYLEDVVGSKALPSADVHLAIGRMRPIDRDALTKTIQARVGKQPSNEMDTPPMFVVATQCLEVGADFDFDAMVSECASLDALRQRFGRLNRRGREIDPQGVIVVRKDQVKDDDDPIYGKALSNTWQYLKSKAEEDVLDFSVCGLDHTLGETDITPMLAPRQNAPVMFPAYVDAWAQTNPIPAPDPDVSLFLHGPERGVPEVQVCWREDLDETEPKDWLQVVGLCPPSSPECMSAPLWTVRKWLSGNELDEQQASDMLDAKTPEEVYTETPLKHRGLVWRGTDKSVLVSTPAELRPGDTLVLPISAEGWEAFGHIPQDAPKDVSERAFRLSRGRVLVRLWPERLQDWHDNEAVHALQEWLLDPDSSLRLREIRSLLCEAAKTVASSDNLFAEKLSILGQPQYGAEAERYPRQNAVILKTRRRVQTNAIIPAMDEGDDSVSRTQRDEPIPLLDHLKHVRETLVKNVERLPLNAYTEALLSAAERHDWGKADERFQAMLLNGTLEDAWAQPTLWGKSAKMPETPALRRLARRRSGLPDGWRHEMLSMQLAETAVTGFKLEEEVKDLVLHLVSSHHGYGRPFAPIVPDETPPDVTLNAIELNVEITMQQRNLCPPHRLDSGVAERFWMLTRRFGWWGLAYLEAVMRLADQRASQIESEK